MSTFARALAAALWHGPLPDPAAPVRDFRARLDTLDYPQALAEARALVRFALPCDAALAAALARWPWSVDLALLVFETSGDTGALEHVVRAQGRRWGTLGWALWNAGQVGRALAVTASPDPASPSHGEDRRAAAELRILADLPHDPVPEPEGLRLDLLALWRRGGGAALAARFDQAAPGFPAHPALWVWLIDTFVTERDFARARAALAAMTRHHGLSHPEVAAQTLRLALEAEDFAAVRAGLKALPDTPVWDWPARRLLHSLRCDQRQGAPGLPAQSAAACRLYPRHMGLAHLHRSAREAVEDWDVLTQAPDADAAWLIRLGRPDLALTRANPDGQPPEARFRHALHRAEACLRLGQIEAARAALPPPPAARPLAADLAWWQAEIALAARDLPTAEAALTPALAHSPTRMGLHLSAARLAYFQGDPARGAVHLAQFRALKTAQLGAPPPDDLRDLIQRDAALGQPGPARTARALALSPPPFASVADAHIPRRIAHYWEGPQTPALTRSLRAWAQQFEQVLFDAGTARDWLMRHAPDLMPLFDRQPLPATRADLFRVALIAREGGLFADLDDYPRAPVDDWLTGARAVLVIEEGHGTLANNFLAAEPGLPLFTSLQTRIAANLTANPTPYPWWDTGPAALTAAFALPPSPGIRLLTQSEYDARVSTNLPFAHKSGPLHWR